VSTTQTVRALLRAAGRTYAEEAGIRLANKPAPLYRLLVTSVLLSTRISADIAVAAAAELVRSGMGTPQRMHDAGWQQRVDALGRAHYKRYDESTATALGEGAELLRDEYRDDLRRLRERAERDPRRIRELLTGFPRLGPVGAQIFCREAQAVWPELRPVLDGRRVYSAWVSEADQRAAQALTARLPELPNGLPAAARLPPAESAVPAKASPYEHIASDLRAAIRCGALRDGDPLPPEKELAARYGVSVSTAHRAVSLLTDAGEVVASRGRRACVAAQPVTEPVTSSANPSHTLPDGFVGS
jgi:DNA-binding transcriptional regulator YhcF (GntR family)